MNHLESNFSILFKALIGLAFTCALGITFLILACALPQYNNWWPMFVLLFYFLSPLPSLVARRMSNSYTTSSSSACFELGVFLTTGILVSSVGLPVILAHVEVIHWGACALVLSANIVVFFTIFGYLKIFGNDDMDYSTW